MIRSSDVFQSREADIALCSYLLGFGEHTALCPIDDHRSREADMDSDAWFFGKHAYFLPSTISIREKRTSQCSVPIFGKRKRSVVDKEKKSGGE
jgi:hypothetical protein